MADRGRDLKFSILSDLSKFEAETAARDLDKLGDSAADAVRDLDKLSDSTKYAGFDDLGKDADRAARDIDDAFDKIARSSRRGTKDLEDDADRAKRSLREVGDEARSSASEAFGSFDGTLDGFADAATEVAAEAGALFGPAGLAIGGALAVGSALFYNSYKEKQEKLAQMLEDFTDELIENNGRLSEEFLNSAISDMGADKLKEYAKVAEDAGINVRDFIRAVAGDSESIEKVNTRLAEQRTQLEALGQASVGNDPGMAVFADGQKKVREALGLTEEALDGSVSAWEIAKSAMSDPVTPTVDGGPAVAQAGATRRALMGTLGRPIMTPVQLDTRYAMSDAQRLAWDIRNQIGTIVIPVRAGQSPYANTSSNSRYR